MIEVISNNRDFILLGTNPKCFTIYDSWKIKDKELKIWFLRQILDKYPYIRKKRSLKSLYNEWKVHNACYKHKWFIKRTKDTDFELNQNFIVKFGYFILSKILRE